MEGIGATNIEALENLIKNHSKIIKECKSYDFENEVKIYDAKRKIYENYITIERTIFPDKDRDNLIVLDFEKELTN